MIEAIKSSTFVVVEKETTATSSEEQQMSALLVAATETVKDISRYYMLMNRARTDRAYIQTRDSFIESLENLVPLLAQADQLMNETMQPAFRSATTKRLYVLRQEVFDISLAFLIERIRRIRQRALAVLKREYHPVGFADCLEQGLQTVISTLKFMGKLDNLPPLQQQLIEETRLTVIKLSAIEGKLDLWKKLIGVKKQI